MPVGVTCIPIQDRGIYNRRPRKSFSDSNARLNLRLTGLFVFTIAHKYEGG